LVGPRLSGLKLIPYAYVLTKLKVLVSFITTSYINAKVLSEVRELHQYPRNSFASDFKAHPRNYPALPTHGIEIKGGKHPVYGTGFVLETLCVHLRYILRLPRHFPDFVYWGYPSYLYYGIEALHAEYSAVNNLAGSK
jgi:hypothetical protein